MSDPTDPPSKPKRPSLFGAALPPERRKEHGKRVTLPLYEGVWEAWKRGTRIKAELCRLFGVTTQTMNKIIFKGYPERGWPSMLEKQRLYDQESLHSQQQVIAKHALEQIDAYDSAKQDNLKLLRAGKAGVANMMRSWYDNLAKVRWVRERRVQDKAGNWSVIEYSLTASEMARIGLLLAQTADNFLKQESLWLGGPTEAINHNAGAPGWFSLTPEQLDVIISSGRLPPGVTDEMLFGAQAVKLLAAASPPAAAPTAPPVPSQGDTN